MIRIKREQRVFKALCELSGEKGWCTAREICDFLGLDRANVSKDLNSLERQGSLGRLPGRPVRFCLPENVPALVPLPRSPLPAAPFDNMIGQRGSLMAQVKQAKAAMLYPPRGLHTMLTGPTGSGKTTFAWEMYEYARHMKIIAEDAAFVVLNCAEYLKNPQLLVSQLFGHRKGAFTGAQSDKIGLVEKANGGILFLDEIHCLPPEGQEMLFTLMDSATYRRLGETERSRTSEVLLIGATTENVETSMLKTFMRRIPVLISFPALMERPLSERLEFINQFFMTEQEKLGIPIAVRREILGRLIYYDCPGNVGQLKADIQLLCAGAFWQYRSSGQTMIKLDVDALPPDMTVSVKHEQDILLEMASGGEQMADWLVWGGDASELGLGSASDSSRINVAVSTLRQRERQNPANEAINISRALRRYIDRAEWAGELPEDKGSKVNLDSMRLFLEFAEFTLGRKLSQKVKMGIGLYVGERVASHGAVEHLNLRQMAEIAERHPEEYRLAKLLQRNMEAEQIYLGNQDVALLALFLCEDVEALRPKVGVIVLACGESTARSIAAAANEILHCEHCRGIDIPVTAGSITSIPSLKEVISHANQGMGVLFFVDMDSLETIVRHEAKALGIAAEVLCMTSTPVVVEAVRLANSGSSLMEVSGKLRELIGDMIGVGERGESSAPSLLLINCPSGKKTGRSIAEMLYAITNLRGRDNLEIRYLNSEGLDNGAYDIRPEERERTLAVVGTANPGLPGIPYISVDELVSGKGISRLEARLNMSTAEVDAAKSGISIASGVLTQVLREILIFLDAEKVRPLVVECLLSCQEQWRHQGIAEERITELEMRYAIHMACMLERLLRREILPYSDMETIKNSKREQLIAARKSVDGIEKYFNFSVPDTELAYLVEILDSAQNEQSISGHILL